MQNETRRTEPKTSGGSPDLKCDRTVDKAATGTSSPEEINVSPVPLFLVPWAVADEIRRHGLAMREINVPQTRNHQYAIRVKRGRRHWPAQPQAGYLLVWRWSAVRSHPKM
ncbi:hypothetical protein [Methanoculleus sp.]|uniref:hypothetical protein n=1 Tax=Methanoculleus sp. TaxID=90427 RepID=UPI0026381BB3|nr:hypothetical protein [Methanoculleus sp.]MDI6720688.1 hypothetical protein [Methanomicrobiales archaeon]MDI6867927.1 hypothetical protein [Methanoculleus sp.]